MNSDGPVSSQFSRRGFLALAGSATAIGAGLPGVAEAGATKAPTAPLVDVNVNLGRWPLRRLAGR
jgi:hypothetical protein